MERSEGARIIQFKRVDITSNMDITFNAYHEAHSQFSPLKISIIAPGEKRRAFYMIQLLSQFSPFYVDYLYIHWNNGGYRPMKIYNDEWLELLLLFTAVRAVYVTKKFATQLSQVLESATTDMTRRILPALELLCLENRSKSVDKFITARRLSGHPITIVNTLGKFDEMLESHFLL